MDYWDKLANPNAKTEAQQPAGTPKPSTEGRDWLDDVIDRQGLSGQRDFVRSIYQQESTSGKVDTSKPNAKGARGPMQVTKVAFDDMQQRGYIPKEYRWDNPEHSAEAGVAYLKYGLEKHGGDTRKAAAFYFGGPSAIRKDGTIETERSDGKTKLGDYVNETHSRIGKAVKTSAPAPTKDIPKWSDIAASPEFAALNSDEREQLRVAYRDEALPKVVPGESLADVQAAFEESTKLSFFDNARLTLKQTGSEFAEGGRNATQGLRGKSLVQDMKRVEEHRNAAAVARAQGDETAAQEYEAAAAAALSEAKKADKEIVTSNKESTFVARSSVQKMLSAKDPGEAWSAFAADPLNVIAGITAQSAAAMAPGLVFAALAGGGIGGALMMGANSAMMENGSSLLDFAAENGVDPKSEGALIKFYSDPDNLRAGLSFAGTRSSIIGAADFATGGAASKTFAPSAVKGVIAKQAINVPVQMAVQAAGGAAGEAGAQVATKGKVDEWGQVLAEAVGELATAPVDVAVLAKDAVSSTDSKSKSASLRDLAKKLRGEPVGADAVIDNPAETKGENLPAVAPRGVAGAPIPDQTGFVTREEREKVDITPDMVLDKGDAGPGNRPALPPPGGPGGGGMQNEIRVDSAGNATPVKVDREVRQIGNEPGLTGAMRVDSAGTVTMETGPQAMEAEQVRQSQEDLGTSPVRVPGVPQMPPKGKRPKTKSMRSEYDANQALSDRAAPGWRSPSGKTIEEVLRARPRPKADPKPETPQRKKLFGLFSKRGITKAKNGAYVAPEERAADPAFKRWFGASKAKQGSAPQVYFHGTAADIEEFRPKQAGAIFLSPDPNFAESFAHASLNWLKDNLPKMKPEVAEKVDAKAREMVRKNYEEQGVDEETMNYYLDNVRMTDEWLYASMDALEHGPNIIPVHVRAERPFDGSDPKQAARIAKHLSAGKGVFELEGNQWTEDDLIESLDRGDWTVLESPGVQKAIKDLGHDGFFVTEGGVKNLAVYNPNQIKSAVGNTQFSESPRIIASRKTKESADATQSAGSRGDDARAVRGSGEPVARDGGQDQGDGGVRTLEGAPAAIDIPGRGRVVFGIWEKGLEVAKAYAKKAGIPFRPLTQWAKVDRERAARIASEYAAMKHDPSDPKVAAAYAAMIKETSEQYRAIMKSGLKVEFIRGEDPYAASPRLAVLDMIENNHLWVFSTRDGFGSNATFDPKDNPLLAETEFEISGEKALANDVFRVVHDYFGHAMYGAGFRADGEENAWRAHSQMYTPQARRAMTSETRGQNSWVNFGPHGETNRSASGSETVYADQKTGLLPAWVMNDGSPTESAKQTDTPAFKRWFGDSKVVNEKGEPLVVYHGTSKDADFTSFRIGQRGSWFTADPKIASEYASENDSMGAPYNPQTRRFEKKNTASRVIPAYLSIKNPYTLTAEEKNKLGWADNYAAAQREVFVRAKAGGYDGIDMGGGVWVAFQPEQIKSSVGNNGDFDAKKTNITKSIGTRSASRADALDSLDLRGDPADHLDLWAKGWEKDGTFDIWTHKPTGVAIEKDRFGHWWTMRRPSRPDDSLSRNATDAKRIAMRQAKEIVDAQERLILKRDADLAKGGAAKSIGSGSRGLSVEAVSKVVDALSSIFKGAKKVSISVYQSPEDVVGLDLKEDDTVDGVYFGEDGSIVLIADAIGSIDRATEVLLHELVGHHGVESLVAAAGPGFERRWIEILKDVARARAKGGYASMASVREAYGDNELINAMEVLARMAETGEQHTLLTKAVSLIRDVLRKLGIKLRMSDSDLIELVLRAQEHVARGENQSTKETKAWHAKLMSMEDEAANALMSQPDQPFYSALKRAVSAINAKAMSALDWKARIKGLKGVKADEIEWSGLNEWLDMLGRQRVSKEEIEDYLNNNGVQLQEAVLSNDADPDEVDGSTRYEDYTTKGGSNYREVVMYAPRLKTDTKAPSFEEFKNQIIAEAERLTKAGQMEERQLRNVKSDPFAYMEDMLGQYASQFYIDHENREIVPNGRHGSATFLAKSHWDVPNPIAHLRLKDRVDADGKRVLDVEEFQSDWGQEGRDNGFGEREVKTEIRQEDDGYWSIYEDGEPVEGANWPTRRLAEFFLKDKPPVKRGTPVGPFVTSTGKWLDLALKRVIKMAVDEGFDRVSFVPGEVASERFSLTQAVSRVYLSDMVYDENGFARGTLIVTGKNGNDIISWPNATARTIEMAIGKEATRKLISEPSSTTNAGTPRAVHVLEGDGLKLSDKGMKGFYDKIVPEAVNAMLKKLGGGRVIPINFKAGRERWLVKHTLADGSWSDPPKAFNSKLEAQYFIIQQKEAGETARLVDGGSVQPEMTRLGFDITPEMRNAARGGFPLFSKKRWSTENSAFEVAPGGNASIKGAWDKLPLDQRERITLALAKAVAPGVAELFTDAKVQVHLTQGGWMGDVNPSVALKMPNASTTEAQNIAAAIAYVFDQDAGLHISAKGSQDAIVVELADGQDGVALYKSLPGNTKEFIGFTSSGDGVMEFLVEDAAKSLPKLQAHFGPAKVTVAQRGFTFLGKKEYKAARGALHPNDQDVLDGFRSQARALMTISLSPERTGTQVSTAPVSAVRTWLDPMKQRISVGIEQILGLGPEGVRVHADLMEKMPNIRPKQGRSAEETIEAAIEHFKSNILWLYDQTTPKIRDRAKLWYVGGNKIARQMGKFYGISHEQAAGLIAVLSPQRDWFVNVSLARRVLDIWKHRQDFTATPEMFRAAVAPRTEQSDAARNEQLKLAAAIDGKKLSELSDPLEAAAWIRSFDEAYNARTYRAISPEGDTLGLAMNEDGVTPAEVQWGGNGTIAAAISILRDGSIENISTELGSGHKVRNFYTNLIDPLDPLAITVDTHAVGVATLRPMSADSEEVKNAFGGNEKGERGPATSTIIGSNGTFGIYAEAYRRAAKERGILPREMQSITWTAIRGLFKAASKRIVSAPVEALWMQYNKGRMTLERLREELKEIADAEGINSPDWEQAHHQLDDEAQVSDDDLGLSGAGRDGGAGRGDPTPQEPRRRLGLKSVAASSGGSGVVEYSRRPPAPGSVAINAWHWSRAQLSELSGFMYGQGIRGAEAERLKRAPAEIRKRVYFYTQRDNGTIPLREAGLGPYRHEVRLANLWKSGISPSIKVEPVGWTQSGIFIRDEEATRNAWEKALLDAGYDGYVDGLSGVAVVLNSNVPVQFVRESSGLKSKAPSQPAGNASPAARTGLLDGAFHLGMGWVGRMLSGPSYDFLIRQGARFVPDRVKHGLVSDFGLEGMYLDAKIDRTAAINKVLRETKNLLDSLAGLTREQSRVAYLWMGEKPDTELEQQLLSQLSVDDRATLRNMKSLIDQLGREAVSAGLLTQDSYERNKMAYLHRAYEVHMKPGAGAAAMKRAAAIRAENFKGRGIRHDVSADSLVQNVDEIKQGDLLDRWESRGKTGKVTSVKYVKHGAAGPKGYTKADTWEARWMDRPGNKVGLWRDMTAEERHKLGEIEEVRFAFAKTVINGIRDIENAKFLKWVADTYSTNDAPADKIIGDPSTGYWATQAFKPDEFVRVPDTEIAGTKIKKYGALAGKIIPAPVWNDIRNQLARPADATSAAWDSLVRAWKVSKTALSPAVHTNNVMSNFVMADLAEVRARDIVKALGVIVAAKKGDADARKMIERFEDSGADYGSFANIELNQLYIEPLLAELEKVENNELGLLKASQIVNLAMHGQIRAAGKAALEKAGFVKMPFELMLKAYQSEDSVFRLAKFMREIGAGQSDRDAGKAARDSFLDYNINAPWVQAARRSVLPFIAFSYRAIPMMLKAAAHKPWKFAKYLAVGYALNAAAYAMLGLGGDDEDRERRLLPDELDGRLLGVFPRLIRMPWNDAHGSPVFLDARRWVPGGDMVDLNQSQAAVPVPSWLSVSGPLSIMMEFFSNKSSFTGREIVKDTDTKAEAASKVGDHLFKAFSPNLPLPGPGTLVPGLDRGLFQTYAWQGMLDAGTGRTDAFGRDQSMATALLSSVGVKARAYPEDALRLRAVQDFQQAQREIQNNIKGLARELSRKGITQEQFDQRVEREKKKLEKASEELRKKL